MALRTAWAIASWPSRRWPPTAVTAASSSSATPGRSVAVGTQGGYPPHPAGRGRTTDPSATDVAMLPCDRHRRFTRGPAGCRHDVQSDVHATPAPPIVLPGADRAHRPLQRPGPEPAYRA